MYEPPQSLQHRESYTNTNAIHSELICNSDAFHKAYIGSDCWRVVSRGKQHGSKDCQHAALKSVLVTLYHET